MTNELEKQFFDTFGIEPRYKSYFCDGWSRIVEGKYFTDKKEAEKFGMVIDEPKYPQITDRILLELICILTEWRQYCASDYIIKAINIDILKNDILKDCLYMSNWYEFKKCGKDINHQVRTLFEES